jgi:hypothetical protein
MVYFVSMARAVVQYYSSASFNSDVLDLQLQTIDYNRFIILQLRIAYWRDNNYTH